MSILVLVRYYPATSETFVRRQAERLSADVICEKFNRKGFDALGLTSKVYEIGEAAWWFDKYCRLRASAGLFSDLWSPAQHRAARRVLKQARPEAVLAHYGPNAIKIAPICKRVGSRLFVHFHGYDASALLRNSSYRRYIVDVLRQCAGAIAVSDPMADAIRELGIEEEKLAVIPCGVDVTMFAERARPKNGKCTFLMVGRLVEKKAPLTTIRAFEECADAVQESELRIIGFGPLRDAVERYASGSRHSERIKVLGPQKFDVVMAEMMAADVFVQHSITAPDGNTEGWPISIAEAAASGLPVVATRHAGIPMQVVDSETGFLVDEGDAESMGKRMAQLARDSDRRVAMGASARAHIAKVGSIEDSVSRLKQFIAQRI